MSLFSWKLLGRYVDLDIQGHWAIYMNIYADTRKDARKMNLGDLVKSLN